MSSVMLQKLQHQILFLALYLYFVAMTSPFFLCFLKEVLLLDQKCPPSYYFQASLKQLYGWEHVKTLLNQVIDACRIVNPFIFTTDGFEPYSWAAKNLLDSICLYAQVIKKRRKKSLRQWQSFFGGFPCF